MLRGRIALRVPFGICALHCIERVGRKNLGYLYPIIKLTKFVTKSKIMVELRSFVLTILMCIVTWAFFVNGYHLIATIMVGVIIYLINNKKI